MKSKFILILNLLISLHFYGQTEKGHFLISGSSNLSLSFTSTEYSNDRNDETTKRDKNIYNISPSAGYFVSDDVALGLLFNYTNVSEDPLSTSSFLAGPFARFYFMKSEKLLPFAQATVSYGTKKREFNIYDLYSDNFRDVKISSDIYGVEFDLGLSVLLSKQVSFDIIAGYAYLSETIPSLYGDGKIYNEYQKTGAFGINLGISVFLGKNHELN